MSPGCVGRRHSIGERADADQIAYPSGNASEDQQAGLAVFQERPERHQRRAQASRQRVIAQVPYLLIAEPAKLGPHLLRTHGLACERAPELFHGLRQLSR